MDDALPVCGGQGVGDLDRALNRLRDAERTALQARRQRFPLDELHDEEIRAVLLDHVEERADVRMIQARDRARLTREPVAA